MKKKSKLFLHILGLFILMNIFISTASADIAIPPCGPGETPEKNFCSNSKTEKRNRNLNPIEENNQILFYSIAGGIIVVVSVISGIVLVKIRRKNVK